MTPAPRPPAGPRAHVLTVGLEDYFQVGAFNRFVQRNQWYRFETRLEQNTARALALLARFDATATFFVLGWVARRFPELVRRVAAAGHEVAVKGYYHRGLRDMAPEEFEADAARAREAAEAASGRRAVGYRVADGWVGPADLWALDSLAALGFGYDSSVAPVGRAWAGHPGRRAVHPHHAGGRVLWEVPVSTGSVFGARVPVAGGNYLRQLPAAVTRRLAARWVRSTDSPMVGYFHVWELDPDQPRLAVGGLATRVRHYRNLDKMEGRLADLLGRYRWGTAAGYLGLSTDPADTPTPARPLAAAGWQSDTDRIVVRRPAAADPAAPAVPVTVVVPCFNEEESLPYLANALHRVRDALAPRYDVRFVLVDDGSSDRTWDGLQAALGGKPGFELARHDRNFGVAAAIMTGIKRARTEVVASMDADCTYDPIGLADMIPLLGPGVDLVTASPYHPAGTVRNVPGWRLVLSKGAAWLYRRVLRHKLHTYTSCFRVYRRSSVAGLALTHDRYLGVAELVGRLDLAGGTVVEHPATLEVRVLGRSKMKTARTVAGHLGLLANLAARRAVAGWRWGRAPRDQVIRSVLTAHRIGQAVLTRRHPAGPPAADPADARRAALQTPPDLG